MLRAKTNMRHLIAGLFILFFLNGCKSTPKLSDSSLELAVAQKGNWSLNVSGDLSTPDISAITNARYPVKLVLIANSKPVALHKSRKQQLLVNELIANLDLALQNTGVFSESAENTIYISLTIESSLNRQHNTHEILSENLDINVLMQDTNNRTAFKRNLNLTRVNKKAKIKGQENPVEAIIPIVIAKNIIYQLRNAEML